MRQQLAYFLIATAVFGVGCTSAPKSNAWVRAPGSDTHSEAYQTECHQRRAAFDIGSSTTRMKVIDVDTCLQKITAVALPETTEPVGYQEDLVRSGEAQAFSPAVMEQGLAAVRKLRDLAQSVHPDAFCGVATSAFRLAKNSSALTERFEKELAVPVRIITQDEEAELGFLGGMALAGVKPSQIVVWDIGGSSMQMTALGPDGRLQVFGGLHASVSFKAEVVKTVKRQDPSKVSSPNPMSSGELVEAMELARNDSKEVGEPLRSRLTEPGMTVVGVGGVLSISLPGQLPTEVVQSGSYSQLDLETVLKSKAGSSDAALGGKYGPTALTNTALVLGYMKGLGIASVRPERVGNADGLVVQPKYWP